MKALALLICALASPALADGEECFDRTTLIATLDRSYSERQFVRSMEDRGGMVEVYVSAAGTWTRVVVPPLPGTPKACVVATGTAWMMVAPGIAG